MKRFILVAMLVMLLLPLASATQKIYGSNVAAQTSIGSNAGGQQWTQTFTVGVNGNNSNILLTNITFFATGAGTNGNVTFTIQTTNSSGGATGTVIAAGFWNADQAGDLTVPQNISFTFNTTVLRASTKYALVMPSGVTNFTTSQNQGYSGGNITIGQGIQPESVRFILWGQNDSTFVQLNTPLNGSSVLRNTNITFNSSVWTFNLVNLTNATLYVWNSTNGLINRTRVVVNGTENQTNIEGPSFTEGIYRWNVLYCGINSTGSNTICNFAYRNFTFNSSTFTVNSQSYNPTSISGNLEYFSINLSYDTTAITSIGSTFYYNSTSYSPTVVQSGNNLVYNVSAIVPFVSTPTNIPFFWSFLFTNASGSSFAFNTSSITQAVSSLGLDNCSTQTTVLIRFKLYDEPTRVETNGTIDALVNLYTPGTDNLVTTFNKSYSFIAGSDNAKICVSSIGSGYTMDYQTQYQINTSYARENKYGQSINVTNSTIPQNISLYDIALDLSEAFTITVQGGDLSTISGALVDVQRQYVSINQFLSVETPITDSRGTSIAHLVENDVLYNFVVSKDGVLLGTFNNYLVKCQNQVTGQCEITLNLIQSTSIPDDYQNFGNISLAFSLNRITSLLSMAFFSIDGGSHTVELDVFKNDGYGNVSICTQSTTASSGTLQCTIPAIYANTSIIAEVSSDGVFVGRQFFSLAPSSGDIFQGIRVILGLLMYSTLTLLFIGNPITVIIGAMLGLFFAGAFHIVDGGSFFGNAGILLWFILAGGLLIYFFSKKI